MLIKLRNSMKAQKIDRGHTLFLWPQKRDIHKHNGGRE